MPRYFFRIGDGHTYRDEKGGEELRDDAIARREAKRLAACAAATGGPLPLVTNC
jgi:hypothetical protein